MIQVVGISQVGIEAPETIPVTDGTTLWALGTGALGGVASIILAHRATQEKWTEFPAWALILGIVVASAANIVIACTLRGKQSGIMRRRK